VTRLTDDLAAVKDVCRALDEKFGRDIVALDIGKVSVIADYFVITEGGSPYQIRALAAAAEEALAKRGVALAHTEGLQTANWALLDFGGIIVHIFDAESRRFYGLERVWHDAEQVEWKD
jgi:ribosome-associated protein